MKDVGAPAIRHRGPGGSPGGGGVPDEEEAAASAGGALEDDGRVRKAGGLWGSD